VPSFLSLPPSTSEITSQGLCDVPLRTEPRMDPLCSCSLLCPGIPTVQLPEGHALRPSQHSLEAKILAWHEWQHLYKQVSDDTLWNELTHHPGTSVFNAQCFLVALSSQRQTQPLACGRSSIKNVLCDWTIDFTTNVVLTVWSWVWEEV
jgi:hypothetical protein